MKKVNSMVARLRKACMMPCDECGGTGYRLYGAKYIDGDLYHDAEWLKCCECNGTGKTKRIWLQKKAH